MKSRLKLLSIAAIAAVAQLSSCSNGQFSAPLYLAVVISPRTASIPVGSTVVFTGTVTNNLSLPQWTLLNSGFTTSAGTLSPVSGSNISISYTAPAAPPIYSNSASTGIVQGTVSVDASATAPPQSDLPVAHDSVTFYITAPTITVNLSPATAKVALGSTAEFVGYAVGSVNNAVVWQVNGVSGGSAATGTIATNGFYTAPATMPMGGSSVTVSLVSQADTTKSASAILTLQ
jgi:hypothetical protein